MSLGPLALALALGLAGLAFGSFYFAVLKRSVDLSSSAPARLAPLALTLARLLGAIAFFTLAARLGSAALLTALLGFLLSRIPALRAGRAMQGGS